jgi:thiamine-phosphate pyrophosphorylase
VTIPVLYAIIDTGYAGQPVDAAATLLGAGVRLLQYRHKGAFERVHWEHCCRIAEISRQAGATFIVNDRVDIALMCGAAGVHLGQTDLPPDAARQLMGPEKIIGYSTHNQAQAREADALPVDYVAIGPVFVTHTKENPEAVVGLMGVTAVRRLVSKPLVAIGGITRQNAASVLAAGAHSVAVVRDLLASPDSAAMAAAVRDFLAVFRLSRNRFGAAGQGDFAGDFFQRNHAP